MLKIGDTGVRKVSVNGKTLHSVKVNGTEVFNDLVEIIINISEEPTWVWASTINAPSTGTQYVTRLKNTKATVSISLKRKDGISIPNAIIEVDVVNSSGTIVRSSRLSNANPKEAYFLYSSGDDIRYHLEITSSYFSKILYSFKCELIEYAPSPMSSYISPPKWTKQPVSPILTNYDYSYYEN